MKYRKYKRNWRKYLPQSPKKLTMNEVNISKSVSEVLPVFLAVQKKSSKLVPGEKLGKIGRYPKESCKFSMQLC
jgi:hypothetical protein